MRETERNALIFYSLMWFFYSYSKGTFKMREDKREKYFQWVEQNGGTSAKAIKALTIIFSILFVLNIVI